MFLPKKSKIFDNLVAQAEILKTTASVFLKLTNDWENKKKYYQKIEKLEGEADNFVHNITDDIEKYFILPLDKEDIKELSETLDDIIDGLDQTACRINIYSLSASTVSIVDFAKLITKAADEVYSGVAMIKENKINSKNYVACYKSLHDIESKGDALHRKILEDLMSEKTLDSKEKTTLGVIKWKEVFDGLEYVLDKSEYLAIIFERLRIKYS